LIGWVISFYRRLVLVAALAAVGVGLADPVEAGSLQLSWADNSNNESGFTIERMAPDGNLAPIATVGANVTSYTDSALIDGQTYCYTVRAFNSTGSSVPSNLACGTAASAQPGGGSGGTGSSGFDTVSTLSNNSDSNSARASVMTGDQVMISGFIIEGTEPAIVLIRGRGPSMGGAPFFLPGVLSNPRLQLFSGSTVIAQNDNWQDSAQCDSRFPCGTSAQILATGLDPCQPNPGQSSPPPDCAYESAILTILPPGAYTAILSGTGGTTGVGLVEVFEIDDSLSPSNLVNVSTRAVIRSADDVMIGGVILAGPTSKTVLIRGRGPSMGGAPFFVPGVLSNPRLQLFSGSTVIVQNDNWQDSPQCDPRFACGDSAQIKALQMDPCQPNPGELSAPPSCSQEAAILVTLPPGAYTAILRGVAGATGVALVEMFDLN
jgi:hypothetical protein